MPCMIWRYPGLRSNSFVVSRDDSINVVIYRVLKIKVLCVLGGGGGRLKP